MLGSEQHFRNTLDSARALELLSALTRAYDQASDAKAKFGFSEARTEPTLGFDLAVNELRSFEAMGGVRHVTVQGQHLWIVDEAYGIRVKRLRSDYQTTNHRSAQQERIAWQLPLEGLPDIVYVSVGPRVSARTGLVLDYSVVKHVAGGASVPAVEWVVDLSELATGGVVATTPTLPLDAPAPAAIVVRRQKAVNE
jgi:hypothetical protein